jgi:hypothetical protein
MLSCGSTAFHSSRALDVDPPLGPDPEAGSSPRSGTRANRNRTPNGPRLRPKHHGQPKVILRILRQGTERAHCHLFHAVAQGY